ncbi:MAG: hypothetical protein ACJ748_07380, partial [Flavisolibacter sp.]
MRITQTGKRWLFIFSVVLVFTIGGYYLLQYIVQNKIRTGLKTFFNKEEVQYSSIATNLFQSTIIIKNLRVVSNNDPVNGNSLTIPELDISGVNPLKLFFSRRLSIGKLTLVNPVIKGNDSIKPNTNARSLHSIDIKKIECKNASVTYKSNNYGNFSFRTNFSISNIFIDSIVKRIDSYEGIANNVNWRDTSNKLIAIIGTITFEKNGIEISADSIRIKNRLLLSKRNTSENPFENNDLIQIDHASLIRDVRNKKENQDISFEKIIADHVLVRYAENGKGSYPDINFPDKLELQVAVKLLQVKNINYFYRDNLYSISFHGNLSFNGFHLLKRQNRNRIEFSNVDFKLMNIAASSLNGLDRLTIKEAELSSNTKILLIHSFKLTPTLGKFEYAKHLGYQADRKDIIITLIRCTHFNFNDFTQQKLESWEVEIHNLNAYIFRDRRLPFKSSYKLLPVSFMNQLPWNLHIGKLFLLNSTVTYEEFPKAGSTAGILRVEGIHAEIFPLVNHSQNITEMKIKAEGSFMGSGTVHANMIMSSHSDNYSINGVFNDLDLVKLNSASENLANIRIKSGFLNKLEFGFTFNERRANGKIIGVYHNLVVQQLKPGKDDTKKVAKFRSFMLRHLIIPLNKGENKSEANRSGVIDYKRDPNRNLSFYMLQALLTGIK